MENGNAVYDSRENCNAIIETASNTILLGCQNTVIPNSILSIGEDAFSHCTGLTCISIPISVTSIGKSAFYECLNLATVIIPNSITNIGDYAFVRSGLKDIYCYAEQLPEIGNDIFLYTYYKETLHVPAEAIETYRNAEQWKDFENIVALTDNDPNPTEIIVPTAKQQPVIVEQYDLSGCRISQPQRGVIIVKMSDGTTKKVVVK